MLAGENFGELKLLRQSFTLQFTRVNRFFIGVDSNLPKFYLPNSFLHEFAKVLPHQILHYTVYLGIPVQIQVTT